MIRSTGCSKVSVYLPFTSIRQHKFSKYIRLFFFSQTFYSIKHRSKLQALKFKTANNEWALKKWYFSCNFRPNIMQKPWIAEGIRTKLIFGIIWWPPIGEFAVKSPRITKPLVLAKSVISIIPRWSVVIFFPPIGGRVSLEKFMDICKYIVQINRAFALLFHPLGQGLDHAPQALHDLEITQESTRLEKLWIRSTERDIEF